MKTTKKLLTLCLAVCLVMGLAMPAFAADETPFTDLTKNWYKAAVAYVYENGLMNGTGETTFAPTGTVNRGMIVTVLHREAGLPAAEDAQSAFTDIKKGKYYYDAVLWAEETGVTTGRTDTTFAPGESVTREEVATFLFRYAEFMGYDTSASAELNFPDQNLVHKYAKAAMTWAVGAEIINGNTDGTLNPRGEATRAELAVMLMRFCENIANASGTVNNPITIVAEEENVASVKKDQTVYYSGMVSGMIMTIENAADATVTVDGKTYTADSNGVITVEFPAVVGRPAPVVIAISSASDAEYTMSFEYPVGSFMNPEVIWDLTEVQCSIEAGNDQGYYYSFYNRAAEGDLAISATCATEGVEFDVIVTNQTTNEMAWLSESEDGTASVAIMPNDFVVIQVAVSPDEKWNYPAADITLNGEVIYPVGSQMNPEIVWDPAEINCAIAEGNSQGYYYTIYNRAAEGSLSFTASCATEGVEYDVILTNMTTYEMAWLSESEDGTVSVEIMPGDSVTIQVAVAPDDNWNYPAADITLNGEIIYPVGTQMNPEIVWDPAEINCAIAEGNSQGYYYTIYNRAAQGSLSFTASCETEGVEYDVIVTNMTTYEMAWLSDSEDGTVSVEINPGDSVTVQVAVSPDENWNYPAADITLSGEIIYPVGSQMNPEIVWDPTEIVCALEEGNSQGYYYTVYNRAAQGSLSFSASCATEGVEYDVILTNMTTYQSAWLSDSADGTVAVEINPGDSVTVQVVASPDENWNYPAAEITLNGEILLPEGSRENPEVLTDVAEIACAMKEGNSQGYYYSFTNNGEAGTLTISLASITEGAECDVILTNMTSYVSAYMIDSSDNTVSIAVGAGETVMVQVVVMPDANWNYPAADIVLKGEIA